MCSVVEMPRFFIVIALIGQLFLQAPGSADAARGTPAVVSHDEGNPCRTCWGSEDANNATDRKVEGRFPGYHEDVTGAAHKLAPVFQVNASTKVRSQSDRYIRGSNKFSRSEGGVKTEVKADNPGGWGSTPPAAPSNNGGWGNPPPSPPLFGGTPFLPPLPPIPPLPSLLPPFGGSPNTPVGGGGGGGGGGGNGNSGICIGFCPGAGSGGGGGGGGGHH
ncbi:uncharacterized protein [Physcomitrium patens]|nr:uncharacterized protein LOC112288906 [Physcomitrium patens]|eukprot:XP_024389405.1 uncharacterized protein LOC112288906 [Physcomitrella patens]